MLHALCTAFLLAAPSLQQDRIILTNGKILTVDRVTKETYKEVVYKTGSTEGRKPAQEVREVEHNLGAAVLDDYNAALSMMQEADWAGAVGTLDAVLEDDRALRLSWVKQHALWRRALCQNALQDPKEVATAVDRLLTEVPDTFFYAPALMLKAEASAAANDTATAAKVYDELAAAVASKGLPELWTREAELGKLLQDKSLSGPDKMKKLQQIVEKNSAQFPQVSSRANVELGGLMLAQEDYAGAEKFFRQILDSGTADSRTEAFAWSGLGDVAYQRGLKEDDIKRQEAYFLDAAMSHLRVILMHKDVVTLVPRSLYFGGRALTRRSDETSKRQGYFLASMGNARYRNSPWIKRLFEELNLKPPS